MVSSRVRSIVLVTVTSVWVANFVLSVVPQFNYDADQQVHAIFTIIVGFIFVTDKRSGGSNGSKPSE